MVENDKKLSDLELHQIRDGVINRFIMLRSIRRSTPAHRQHIIDAEELRLNELVINLGGKAVDPHGEVDDYMRDSRRKNPKGWINPTK